MEFMEQNSIDLVIVVQSLKIFRIRVLFNYMQIPGNTRIQSTSFIVICDNICSINSS